MFLIPWYPIRKHEALQHQRNEESTIRLMRAELLIVALAFAVMTGGIALALYILSII